MTREAAYIVGGSSLSANKVKIRVMNNESYNQY